MCRCCVIILAMPIPPDFVSEPAMRLHGDALELILAGGSVILFIAAWDRCEGFLRLLKPATEQNGLKILAGLLNLCIFF